MGWQVLDACMQCVWELRHPRAAAAVRGSPAAGAAACSSSGQAPDPLLLPALPALCCLLQEDLGATLALLAGQGAKFDKDAYICDIKVNIPDRF